MNYSILMVFDEDLFMERFASLCGIQDTKPLYAIQGKRL